jgi:hypothetical protein
LERQCSGSIFTNESIGLHLNDIQHIQYGQKNFVPIMINEALTTPNVSLPHSPDSGYQLLAFGLAG